MTNKDCDIIQDLLPLYIDSCCHPGSRELVEEHLKTCPACQKVYGEMTGTIPAPEQPQPELEESSTPEVTEEKKEKSFRKGMKKIRRRWITSLIVVVILVPFVLMGVAQVTGDGLCYTNLHEFYLANAFLGRMKAGDYEGAAQYIAREDVRERYLFSWFTEEEMANFDQDATDIFVTAAQGYTEMGGLSSYRFHWGGYASARVSALDEEEKVVGTLGRYHLIRPRRKRVVLVDHNEKAQSVPGLEQAEIMEIIDHHRLADVQTGNPVFMRNEPVGSTTTIIATMYQERGLMPSEKLAGLMAAAILSDTVMFKSPTCTPRDKRLAERLARIAGLDLKALGKQIFSASVSSEKSVEELLRTDFKEFHIAGHSLGIGQITCLDTDAVLARLPELLPAMEKMKAERGYDLQLLMLTDVLREGTELVFLGDEDVIRMAFDAHDINDHHVFLPHVVSRKKQIVPALSLLWG